MKYCQAPSSHWARTGCGHGERSTPLLVGSNPAENSLTDFPSADACRTRKIEARNQGVEKGKIGVVAFRRAMRRYPRP